MKIISILHNEITGSDLALCFRDNYLDDVYQHPSPPHNSANIAHTKSGMPLLQVEFWRNEKFKKYFWFGEPIWFSQDEDTDFVKHGSKWLDFMDVYKTIS
jgi:hypothetical protein